MKALTIHYPWCYLWLMDIKINETRTRGVRCNLPTQLIVHCAKKKPDASAKKLADKYLGADFRPDYGHVIGICNLTSTFKMTSEFIQSQSQQGATRFCETSAIAKATLRINKLKITLKLV